MLSQSVSIVIIVVTINILRNRKCIVWFGHYNTFTLSFSLAIISYLIVSLSVLSFLLAAKTKKIRTKAFTLQYIFRIIILLVRLSKYGCGHHYTHIYYIMMEAFCGSAAIMNALHIPERWFLGKLDYIFNGHTMMHIFTTFGMALSRKGFLLDMEWMSRTPQCL